MAKEKTQMAEEAAAQAAAEKAESKSHYIAPASLWDTSQGTEFGGQSDILDLDVGEVAGPLSYIGAQPMKTELGDTTVHTATTKDGETVRLPIQATFLRAIDQAGLRRGDTFITKRFEDVIKKKGKGAGQPMRVYAVKVLDRAAQPGA